MDPNDDDLDDTEKAEAVDNEKGTGKLGNDDENDDFDEDGDEDDDDEEDGNAPTLKQLYTGNV